MTSSTAPRRRPSGRYDEPTLVGQRVLAGLLAFLFIALIVAVVTGLYGRFVAGEGVRGRVISFNVQSDTLVVLDVEVSKPKGAKAYCVVRSRGARGQEVGRDVAVLDAVGSPERVARGTFRLTTAERAVTGELGGCTDTPLTREDITP